MCLWQLDGLFDQLKCLITNIHPGEQDEQLICYAYIFYDMNSTCVTYYNTKLHPKKPKLSSMLTTCIFKVANIK